MEINNSEPKESDNSGVTIPEDFQIKVANLLDGATKEQMQYVQNYCFDCMAEMRRKEDDESYSTKDMPVE